MKPQVIGLSNYTVFGIIVNNFSSILSNYVAIIKVLYKFVLLYILGKKSKAVTDILNKYFDTAPNPYLSTLRILLNAADFNNIKPKSSISMTSKYENFFNFFIFY